MKKKLKRLSVSFVCLFLAISILFMTACSNRPIQPDVVATLPTETSCSTETTALSDTTTAQPPVLPEEDLFEDYELNPTKDFVCRLIYSDLNRQYDTFTGYITLNTNTQSEDVNEIYGISYVDYQEGYIDDNGKTYFSSGFIRFPGEPILDNAIISQGLEIVSLEEPSDELFSYIYAYSTKDLHQHCVYNNQYIKYDIINGEIQYTEEPYTEGMSVDPTRGNIYNYDTEQYVYIVTKQDYIPVSGVSILGEADYQDILNEVNRILREQEANFSYAEIETYVSYSQEAFLSYLLGLQEETFIGISTSKLIQAAENIDPMQHLRIEVDESGCTNIQIINVSRLSGMEEKIIASLIGAFATVGGIVLNLIPSATIFKVFAGAVVGASMEVFSQVVLNNTPTSDIQWEQMAVAIISGAISGSISISLGNYQTQSVLQNFMKESIDTLCDSIIGGGEYFTNALIAGQSFEEACQNFGYGVIAGAVISSAFKLGSLAIKPVTNAVKKVATSLDINSFGNNIFRKLSKETTEDGLSEVSEKAVSKSAKNAAKKGITNQIDDLQSEIDHIAASYNKPQKIFQKAKEKGLEDIKITVNGGPTFKDSPYIYKTDNGKKAIISIIATGNYANDFDQANKAFNFSKTPDGYTWHHLDDLETTDGKTFICTLELVKTDVHEKLSHRGAMKQYIEAMKLINSHQTAKRPTIQKNRRFLCFINF